MQPSLENIIEALHDSWTAETSYIPSVWSKDNPARGQCVVSSLVLNDYFEGDFQKYKVYGEVQETHYCNRLWGDTLVDSTGRQYDGFEIRLEPVEMDLDGHNDGREKLLFNPRTNKNYMILKSRVEQYLKSS